MNEILIYNAHLIIDGHKEVLNGGLLIKDQHIERVFISPISIKGYQNIECLDAGGLMIFPSFISLYNPGNIFGLGRINKTNDLGIYLDSYVYTLSDLKRYDSYGLIKMIDYDPIMNKDELLLEELIRRKIILNIKTMANAYEEVLILKKLARIVIYNLFEDTPPFGLKKPNLSNLAFDDCDCYVNYCFDKFHESIDKLVLNNIRKPYLIVDTDDYATLFKKLKNYGFSNSELLMISSLNKVNLLGLDAFYGTLTRGKFADLVFMNDDYQIVKTMVKGVING